MQAANARIAAVRRTPEGSRLALGFSGVGEGLQISRWRNVEQLIKQASVLYGIQNANVAFGAVAELRECLLVCTAAVCRDCGIGAIEADDGCAQSSDPSNTCTGLPRARNTPPAARIAGPANST